MKSIRVTINPQEALSTLLKDGKRIVVPIQESPYYQAVVQRSPMPILEYLDRGMARDYRAQCLMLSNVLWTISLVEIIKEHGFRPREFETWPLLRGRQIVDGQRRVAFCAALGLDAIEVENEIQGLYSWWSQAFKVGDSWIDVAFPPDYEPRAGARLEGYQAWAAISAHLHVKGKSVLDLGCGPGFYCHRAVDGGAVSVFGIDRNQSILQTTNPGLVQDVVAQAEDTAFVCGYHGKIEFVAADLNLWQPRQEQWDVVLALRAHYHMANPTRFLIMATEAAREALVLQCNPSHEQLEAATVEFTKAVLSPLWREIKVVGDGLPILICEGKRHGG